MTQNQYYWYCKGLSGFDWIRDCGDDFDRFLAVLFVLALIVFIAGSIGLLAYAAVESIDASIKKTNHEAEMRQIERDFERTTKMSDLYDVQLTRDFRQNQLEHLDRFRKDNDL